jgi:hypothetical protein
VELHEFDQLACTAGDVEALLGGDRLDIVIDDGLHSQVAITRTLDAVAPFLAKPFVYFIEDNSTIHRTIAERNPEFLVGSFGELTVLGPRTSSSGRH